MNHLSINKTTILTLFLLHAFVLALQAQITEHICQDDYHIDAGKVGTISLKVDNISFFKDNEYSGPIIKGYTLPGLWLQPKLAYYPLKNLKLEAGLHALIYHGARKFPNYAYQDIASWQGNQYQEGAHVLPYFRAHLLLSGVNLVWGNLYGGSNHKLIEPLYSPELNLTADPEAGFQLLWDTDFLHWDAWIDWQSFIFKNDTHQEAFVVGTSAQFMLNDPQSRMHLYVPVQAIAQHRGGEIDTIYTSSVSTLLNYAAGAGITWNINRPVLKRINLEADVVGYYQQNGTLWPLKKGLGIYAKANADLGRGLRIQGGYYFCKDFISILGTPYFGSVSTTDEGLVYDRMRTAFASLEYSRTIKKYYAMGAKAEFYYVHTGTATTSEGERRASDHLTSYSLGVYFRLNLDVLLWKNIK